MTLSILDPKLFYFATLAGCHAVVHEREMLNAINVFPVQDGDTGDNLAATASAIIHHASEQASIKGTLHSIAHASLIGARGNSGMIFSQFFNALADHALEEDDLNVHRFGELLSAASQRVRSSILNPMEGTMLTIMEQWSSFTRMNSLQMGCFKTLLQEITVKLREAVAQTTQTLAVLKQAGVVDAGALGFFHFVRGFSQFVADPSVLPDTTSLPQLALNYLPDQCAHELPTQGRYCTEAMIKQDQLDSAQLMECLKQYGESIVISANSQQCRFHLHTDTPWSVFYHLQTIGTIQHPKVDDMLRQFQTIHQRKQSIAFVSDSNIDMPQTWLDEHQIHLIPLNLHIGDHDFLDKYSLNSEQFFDLLTTLSVSPKTSCPSSLIIEQKFRALSEKYEQVIVFSVSQALSGTHDALKVAAEKFNNIQVINTKHCSAAQALLMLEAVEQSAQHPTLSVEHLVNRVESQIPHTFFWFTAPDLTALIRSGRMNKFLGKMAQLSGLKPLFSMEGKAHLYAQSLNESTLLQKMIHAIELKQSEQLKLKRYAVVHANAYDMARQFAAMIEQRFMQAPDFIETVSSAVGIHSGPGCIGLAALFEPVS